MIRKFLEKLMDATKAKPLFSDEHYSVDRTMLQARIPIPHYKMTMGRAIRYHRHEDEFYCQLKGVKKWAKAEFRGIKLSNTTHRKGTNT